MAQLWWSHRFLSYFTIGWEQPKAAWPLQEHWGGPGDTGAGKLSTIMLFA